MDYGVHRKPKFLCGVVLQINGMNYFRFPFINFFVLHGLLGDDDLIKRILREPDDNVRKRLR